MTGLRIRKVENLILAQTVRWQLESLRPRRVIISSIMTVICLLDGRNITKTGTIWTMLDVCTAQNGYMRRIDTTI